MANASPVQQFECPAKRITVRLCGKDFTLTSDDNGQLLKALQALRCGGRELPVQERIRRRGKGFLRGTGEVLNLFPGKRDRREFDFPSDADAIRSDWLMVGADLYSAILSTLEESLEESED